MWLSLALAIGAAILGARPAHGRSLCILERGQGRIPGAFPDNSQEIVDDVRSSQRSLGLDAYHIHPEVDVFVQSGLSGTSLINANVFRQAWTTLLLALIGYDPGHRAPLCQNHDPRCPHGRKRPVSLSWLCQGPPEEAGGSHSRIAGKSVDILHTL